MSRRIRLAVHVVFVQLELGGDSRSQIERQRARRELGRQDSQGREPRRSEGRRQGRQLGLHRLKIEFGRVELRLCLAREPISLIQHGFVALIVELNLDELADAYGVSVALATVTPVPEPATAALVATGVGLLLMARRKK